MRRSTRVCIGEQPRAIGTLRFESRGARQSAAFEYGTEWLAAPDRFAIDPALTLVAGAQFPPKTAGGSIFPSAIADTEPDGWARRVILRDLAKQRQQARKLGDAVEPRTFDALDFLLAVDDVSRVGALRFQDDQGVFRRAREPGDRGIPPLVELSRLVRATRAVEAGTESAADLEYLRGRGTSVGGLRPKCTVVDAAGRLSIGKFPSVGDERAVTKGEVLAMQLAGLAGVRAAPARLVDSDGSPVALITRFDRAASGGRVMYVSAATFIGADRDGDGEHSYTEIVDALRTSGAAAQADIEELFRRIALAILITNVDDHLLNHGFLHAERGLWRLAPAFDLNPFPDRQRELKTWISEETGPSASIDALCSVRAYFRVSTERARDILRAVERAVGRWREVGRQLGMTKIELDEFAAAFEHGERAAARRAR